MELKDNQFRVVVIGEIRSKKGNPAVIDGAPLWLTDNPAVLALTPADDGMSCRIDAIGPIGAAKVSIKIDADLGEGFKYRTKVIDVAVIAGEAMDFDVDEGEAQDQEDTEATTTTETTTTTSTTPEPEPE